MAGGARARRVARECPRRRTYRQSLVSGGNPAGEADGPHTQTREDSDAAPGEDSGVVARLTGPYIPTEGAGRTQSGVAIEGGSRDSKNGTRGRGSDRGPDTHDGGMWLRVRRDSHAG